MNTEILGVVAMFAVMFLLSSPWADITEKSAILSAVIFNAIIIPLSIPLALRGVAYKPIGASALLRRNLFI